MRSGSRIAVLLLSLATICGSTYLAGADKGKSDRRQEEDLIRTVYAKVSYADEVRIVLDAFQRTKPNQLWKSKASLVDPALESRLSFTLTDFTFGKISSIADRKMADFDGSPTWIDGEVLDASPGVFNYSSGGKSSSKYVAYIKFAWKPSPYHALSPAESWPVAKALQAKEFGGKQYTDYVTYTATATLAGKSRTYKAWALFRTDEKGRPDFYFMDAVANPTAVTFGWQHSLYPAAFAESDLRTVPFIDKWLYDNARSCKAPHSETDDKRTDVCCDPQTGQCGVAKSSLPPYSSRRPAAATKPAQLVPASFHISELPIHAAFQQSYDLCNAQFSSGQNFPFSAYADQEHTAGGDHAVTGNIVGVCTYSDQSTGFAGPCNVTCETHVPKVEISDFETDVEKPFHHEINVKATPLATSSSNGGSAYCTVVAGGGVNSCIFSCAVKITVKLGSKEGVGVDLEFDPNDLWDVKVPHEHKCEPKVSIAPVADGGGSGGGGDICLVNPNDPSCTPILSQDSPIIIDTNGEGFHLTSAKDGVKFDISGTGKPIQLGWTDPRFHNAFLALPGANGVVDNGKELFGNFTPQPKSKYPNGFIALAQYDKRENGGNEDGIIDEKDQVFSKLRLWIDENHDGVCQPKELHGLAELGVYSLELKYRQTPKIDEFGNQFRYRGRINPGDRKDPRDHTDSGEPGRWIYDVFFVAK